MTSPNLAKGDLLHAVHHDSGSSLLAVKTGAIRYRITWAQERSSYGRVLAQLIKHDYLDANEILLVGWCRLP
jgi:hypothetical protein